LKDAEAVYGGEYIDVLEEQFGKEKSADVRMVGQQSAEYILREYIQKTVREKMQVTFDQWTSEANLHREGFVDRAIAIFQEKGLTYETDGALWFRSTDFGDDKDRVLIKSDGSKTYFASDSGHILWYKEARGVDQIIEFFGADHYGYINRFRAVAQALGFTLDPKFVIVQLVKVVKDGKEVRMSKRAGNVVAIDDLIDTVGHDVARFFFLMYSPDTHMNFDLGLAEERSQKNPVYYVQYAHARMANILVKAGEAGIVLNDLEKTNLSLLKEPKAIDLIRELRQFPALVAEVAENYQVHKLPHYAIRIADRFHSFYAECRVIDAAQPELTQSRLALVRATKIVLAETLRLIGVSAPERM
jgi:arginyl-tRNA synthetase